MGEPSKKNPRKSKLVPRVCTDVDEVFNATKNLEKEKPVSLLDKIKSTTDVVDYVDDSQTSKPVQFSVEVEVESFHDKVEVDPDEYNYNDSNMPTTEIIIPLEVIKNELEATAEKATDFIERRLRAEAANCLGVYMTPPVLDRYEKLIQEIISKWRSWAIQSKFRVDVLAYKCTICSVGWWHLGPFEEHIRIHKDVKLSLETMHHECCIVASGDTFSFDSVCQIYIEGDCPRCLRSYKHHQTQKHGSLYYICRGCSATFTNCRNLFAHEGMCVRFEKILYATGEYTHEEQWICNICKVFCLTEQRHTDHVSKYHSVRSDEPMVVPHYRECNYCGCVYFVYVSHWCHLKPDNQRCASCWKKFQNRNFAKIHDTANAGGTHCPVCRKYLSTQCALSKHCLQHSGLYRLAYRCTECADSVLVASLAQLVDHKRSHHAGSSKPDLAWKTYHNGSLSKTDRRRMLYHALIVPKQCMSKEWANPEKVPEMVLEPLRKRTTVAPTKEKKQSVEVNATKAYVGHVSKELANKFLNRAKSRSSGSFDLDNDNSQHSRDEAQLVAEEIDIKDEFDEVSVTNSNDGCVKDDNSDDNCDDDDIHETENSVNALLGNIKHEIDIEEDDLSYLEDSQSSSVKIEAPVSISRENGEVNVENAVNDITEVNVISDDEVEVIEQSDKNEWIDVSDDDDFEREQQECLEELSKVFQAAKKTKSLKLSNLQVDEVNINIKSEPIFETGPKSIESVSSDQDEQVKSIQDTEVKKEKSGEIDKITSIVQEPNKSNVNQFPTAQIEVTIKNEPEVTNKSIETSTQNEENNESLKINDPVCTLQKSKSTESAESISTVKHKKSKTADAKHKKSKTAKTDGVHGPTVKIEPIDPDNPAVTVKEEMMEIEDHNLILLLDPNNKQNQVSTINIKVPPETYADLDTERTLARPGPSRKKNAITKNLIYKCPRCDFTTDVRSKYNKHGYRCRQQIAKWEDLRCTKCDSQFDCMKRYITHFHKSHNFARFSCPQCRKVMKHVHAFTNHLIKHIKKTFVKLNVLKESEVTVSWTGLYQCRICHKQEQFRDFFSHWERHLDINTKPSEEEKEDDEEEDSKLVIDEQGAPEGSGGGGGEGAPPGGGNLLAPKELQALLDQLLTDERTTSCAHCGRRFIRLNDMKRHVIEHVLAHAFAAARRGVLRCPVCRSDHRTGQSLKVHMRHHGSLPIFRCELCDRCFSDSSNFAKHKKVHNLQHYTCKICRKKYYLEKHLKSHMQMHREHEPVRCDICGATCYSGDELASHRRRKHRASRLHFPCQYCGLKFQRLREKWDHLWEVHGVRATAADCPVCDKSFRKYALVRAHLRQEHGLAVTADLSRLLHTKGLNRKERHERLLEIIKESVKKTTGATDGASPAVRVTIQTTS